MLRLKPLEALGRSADARDRGTLIHAVLERFVLATQNWPGSDQAREVLMEIADEVIAEEVSAPDLKRIWRARLERSADWFIRCEAARRQAGMPLGPERSGKITLDLPGGPFLITAKADRIDRLSDGSAAIYDYKTGSAPTKKTLQAQLDHQLHVQAAMLAAGGFDDMPPLEASYGEYIVLSGSGAGGSVVSVANLGAEKDAHMAHVIQLLESYDAGRAYISQAMPQFETYPGDYDHLARRAEWSGTYK